MRHQRYCSVSSPIARVLPAPETWITFPGSTATMPGIYVAIPRRIAHCAAPKQKPPAPAGDGGFLNNSLTMTYFHTGCSTIIGAKSFHGPVRDGKGWYQLAMVIRHDGTVAGARWRTG